MDAMTFIERIVHSVLSWPVAAVVIVIVLRNSLGELIRNVRHLTMKAGGAEVAVDREVAQIEAEVDASAQATTPPGSAMPVLSDSSVANILEHFKELELEKVPNSISRIAAVVEAYEELERWIATEVGKLSPSPAESVGMDSLPSVALARGFLTPKRATVLRQLKTLRDVFEGWGKKGRTLPEATARNYIETAGKFPTTPCGPPWRHRPRWPNAAKAAVTRRWPRSDCELAAAMAASTGNGRIYRETTPAMLDRVVGPSRSDFEITLEGA
jgi:hypothetical protein